MPAGEVPSARYNGLLRPFGHVYRNETVTVLLLMLGVFLLLTSYYLLKVVREGLILAGGGAEVKAYSAAGQALLLVGVVQVYSWLYARVRRMRLIVAVYAFFVVSLLGFFVLSRTRAPIAVPFYLWVGIFNVTAVAQFWALANDLYTPEQGHRLFAIVAIGSAAGAVAGSEIAGWLLVRLGLTPLMPLAAGILLLCLALVGVVVRRESRRLHAAGGRPARPDRPGKDPPGKDPLPAVPSDRARPEPPGKDVLKVITRTRPELPGKDVLKMIARDRYLVLVAALTLLLNSVNTMGEYVLDRTLLRTAAAAATNGGAALQQFIGEFRADFFFWVNVCGLVLQLFVVSRLIRYAGVRLALLVLPLVSLGGYTAVAVVPLLSVIAVAKVAENSLDYSLENTARQALFLITPRDAKYKAKLAIDTFVWRMGDLLAASLVWLGTRFALATVHFVWINIVLATAWLGVTVAIARLHRARCIAAAGVAA